MNLQFYYEKLLELEEYKKFVEQHKEAYLCSGLFIIDKSANKNEVSFDFYVPSSNEIFSFKFDEEVKLVPMKNFGEKPPEKLEKGFDIEIEEFEKMILERMKEEKISNMVQKFLFSFQHLEGKPFFSVTIFLSNMALLKVNIDIQKKEIVFFKKQSLLDMMNVFKKK